MNFLSLIFRFQGDNSDFKSKVKDSENSVRGMKGNIDSLSSAMSSGLSKAAGWIAAAGVSWEAFKYGIKGAIEDAKAFRILQQDTGLPIDQIQFYSKAAKKANEDTGLLVKTFEKLKMAQAKGLEGGPASDAAKGLEKLGFSFEQLKNSTPGELYAKFMDDLAQGTLTSEQAVAAHEALGKSFHQLGAVAAELGNARKKTIFGADEIAEMNSFQRAFEGMAARTKLLGGQFISQIELVRKTLATKGIAGPNGRGAFIGNVAGTMIEFAAEGKRREDAVKAAEQAQIEENKRTAEFQERVKQSQTHQSIMDRVADSDEKANDAKEKARLAELTDEQRINELLKQRAKLKEHLEAAFFHRDREDSSELAEIDAQARQKLAETNLEIAQMAKKNDSPFNVEQREGSAKVGLFVGGRRDPLIDINQQSLNKLGEIKSVLDDIKNRPARGILD